MSSLIRCRFSQWGCLSIHDSSAALSSTELPERMSKHRQKNSDKSAAPLQEDAPKKPQKSTPTTNGGPSPQGPRSSSGCLGLLATTLFYVALIGAAGFAAFHLQQVVEEFRHANAKHEESARRNAEMSGKMESVVQQVDSLKSVVDGLESSLGITRRELETAVSRMKRGEVETRRVEEALQKLQNDLLKDLSDGIKEVKEARELDFSSLEKAVEERLAEVSQSITASVGEFTESQGEVQTQLADLRARLGGIEDPTHIKQELSAIVDVVSEIKTANQVADATADSLRQQIGAVREEIQTRNREVSSLSEEVKSVWSLVQETTGSLKKSLSAAEAEVQAVKEKSEAMQSGVEQVTDAARGVEERADAAAAQAQKKLEDLDVRVKASEETADSLSASLSDVNVKIESLFAKYDAHESSFASQGAAVEKIKADLKQELEKVKSSLEELQSKIPAGGDLMESDSMDSISLQVDDLEKRLAAVEASSGTKPEHLESSTKLEDHDEAIAALQEVLQKTSQELAGLSESMEGAEKSSVEELRSKVAALSGEQKQLHAKDSDLDGQVGELKVRLAALEESSSRMNPEQLESLRTMVDGLESKAAKLEGHDEAISALEGEL
ncbi:cytoskeleton-associated protein 4 [Oryzias latipes]|nr:cytoskeleton-associated protein 4 [Oryzias latipes]